MKTIEEYDINYGMIPDDYDQLLPYLERELRLTEKDLEKIQADDDKVRAIPWVSLKILLPIVPKPSPRPRYSSKGGFFYVSRAADNKKIFKYYIDDKYSIIYTNTKFHLKAYLPTPTSSMNRIEIYRAEEGTILPTSNPDFDNLLKTYSDMIQDQLIINDNIVTVGTCEKYYSVKPRVEIIIEYQLGFDSRFNKRRTMSSKSYQSAIELGHNITLYTEEGDLW